MENASWGNDTGEWGTEPYGALASALIAVVVGLIILCITLGNLLVIVAVLVDRKLKAMLQNWLIVSLAVADFLVGLLIMPLTLTYALVGRWVLGLWLCELWLALDVLFVTASILNLCTISLDRYWSITDPLRYPQTRSPKKMGLMILVCWLVSSAISLPPVLGWRPVRQPGQCTLSTDLGYVLYSGLGSFWIPTSILVAVYIRIAQISRRRSKKKIREIEGSLASTARTQMMMAQNMASIMGMGAPQTNGGGRVAAVAASKSSTSDDEDETPLSSGYHSPHSNSVLRPTPQVSSSVRSPQTLPPALVCEPAREAGLEAESSLMLPVTKSLNSLQLTSTDLRRHMTQQPRSSNDLSVYSAGDAASRKTSATVDIPKIHHRRSDDCGRPRSGTENSGDSGKVRLHIFDRFSFRLPSRSQSRLSKSRKSSVGSQKRSVEVRKSLLMTPGQKAALYRKRMLKKKERRGTMILGFIMASFVVCWLPFFTLYFLGVFLSEEAIPSLVFDVFFWLGYCNSAFNPVIYGVFNPEFKRAFIKILRFRI